MSLAASTLAPVLGIAVALGGSFAVGCSSSSDTASDSQSQAASLCGSDPRAQTFSANMVQVGKSGTFSIKIISMDNFPVVKGDNAWTVEVLDATGNPATGATFTLKPFMPDHGHGSSIVPDIEPGTGDATFNVGRINTFMPGIWQFTFSITKDTTADSAVVTFCVPD